MKIVNERLRYEAEILENNFGKEFWGKDGNDLETLLLILNNRLADDHLLDLLIDEGFEIKELIEVRDAILELKKISVSTMKKIKSFRPNNINE